MQQTQKPAIQVTNKKGVIETYAAGMPLIAFGNLKKQDAPIDNGDCFTIVAIDEAKARIQRDHDRVELEVSLDDFKKCLRHAGTRRWRGSKVQQSQRNTT